MPIGIWPQYTNWGNGRRRIVHGLSANIIYQRVEITHGIALFMETPLSAAQIRGAWCPIG